MKKWYVLKTKPRAERQVASLLDMRGATQYLPLVRSLRNKSRMEPLFPGYLFCQVKIPSVQWVEMRSLPGIAYVLNAQGVPIPVPPETVEAVRLRAELESGAGEPSRFRPGERVLICDGPFQGLEGAFDRRLGPAGRAQVFINMLNRLVSLAIPEVALRKVG